MRLLTAFLLISCLSVNAQTQDVDLLFIALGKKDSYRQDADGKLHFLNYYWFSDVLLKPGGVIEYVMITPPGGSAISSPPQVDGQKGRRSSMGILFGERLWMDMAFPDGNYQISLKTNKRQIDKLVLPLQGNFPAAPVIKLLQEGQVVSVDKVNPEMDLDITWQVFAEGRNDRNPVLEDIIFVVLNDCRNKRLAFGGRPFDGTPYLNYMDTGFRVNAELLQPGQSYASYVEFAIISHMDTSANFPAMTSYAPTTYLDFKTSGDSPAQLECPATIPQMEYGQTDR